MHFTPLVGSAWRALCSDVRTYALAKWDEGAVDDIRAIKKNDQPSKKYL